MHSVRNKGLIVAGALLATASCLLAAEGSLPLPAVIAASEPAVVLIMAGDNKSAAQGSGFFVRPSGVVVTNAHVIKGYSSFVAKRPDGALYLISKVLAVDETHDLALLQASAQGVPTLNLSESEPILGEEVVAIGSPIGLEGSVSNGIVSGRRTVAEESWLIQTTAPISHGSSGGPLLNLQGAVIGVTSASLTEGQNLNFAVPVRYVRDLLRSLDQGTVASTVSAAPAEEDLGLWKGRTTPDLFAIVRRAGRLYTERRFAQALDPSDFERCELVPTGTTYSGTCVVNHRATCRGAMKSCALALRMTDVAVSGCKLSGLAEGWTSFDCGTCTATHHQDKHFLWERLDCRQP